MKYCTDPAGNRIADRVQYPALPARFADNRISEDAGWFYHYDEHGRLTRKDERNIRDGGSHSHHYHYDHRHRLVHHRLTQQGQTLRESRYLYDPQGRRVGKRVWYSPDREPEVAWYGHDGDRLTTTQTEVNRIQTVYLPGSFTPLLRIETEMTELAQAGYRTLAQKLQQDANVTFPPALVTMLDGLEAELRRGEISPANQQWLAQCGLTPAQMERQLEPVYTPLRKLHLYHCDHRGLLLALVCHDGRVAWQAEYDEWGSVLREDNPDGLAQLIRLPGQQYDAETGLCYNRHRYYDPVQGRYTTQDPIGLKGGLNVYVYPLNPVVNIDPLGLNTIILSGGPTGGNPIGHTAMAFSGMGVYSYGTGTEYGSELMNYLTIQATYRSTVGCVLNTTPEQERIMVEYINKNYKHGSDYNIALHNCAIMVADALSEANVANLEMQSLLENHLLPQNPLTLKYLGVIASKGNVIPFPENTPLPKDIAHFNPGLKN